MKIKISLFFLIACIAGSPMALGQEENKNDIPPVANDLVVPGKLGVGTPTPTKELEVNGYIKTNKGLCLGEDCKEKWPALKCADYKDRPAGESGDAYCNSQQKACTAVTITGSGAEYFTGCSDAIAATHKTRCCWVE